jgi:hypothetical protein
MVLGCYVQRSPGLLLLDSSIKCIQWWPSLNCEKMWEEGLFSYFSNMDSSRWGTIGHPGVPPVPPPRVLALVADAPVPDAPLNELLPAPLVVVPPLSEWTSLILHRFASVVLTQ